MQINYKAWGLLILAAILYGLGYPTTFSTSFLFTQILSLAILIYVLIHAPSWKMRFLQFIFFNSVLNIFSFSWITHTLQEFGQLPWIVAFLLNLLFAFIIGPHFWVALFITYFLDKNKKLKFETLLTKPYHSFLLAIAFTFIEHFTPTQFPSNLGAPWLYLGKYLGFADIGGLPLYSFFSYWIVFIILSCTYRKRIEKINLATIFLFIILNPLLVREPTGKEKTLNIRVVQANISNFLKLDSEAGSYPSVKQVLDRYTELSVRPYEEGELDLIIWPETAYPYSIATNKKDISDSILPSRIAEIIFATNSQMFIGGYDERVKSTGSYYLTEYNAAFHIGQDARIRDVYHKQILIPFGETLPFGPLNKFLSPLIENIAFFATGEKFTIFNLKNGIQAIGAICYEILEPDFIRKYLNLARDNPELIINLTNDSWYGDTAEPRLHKFMSKWRALENNITIIRSTNTGITSVIYPDGEESKDLGIFKAGNLDLKLKVHARTPTLYQRFGIWILIPCFAIYLIFLFLLLKYKREENE